MDSLTSHVLVLTLSASLCGCRPSSSDVPVRLASEIFPPASAVAVPESPPAPLAPAGGSTSPSDDALALRLLGEAARLSGLEPITSAPVLLVSRNALADAALGQARRDVLEGVGQAYAELLARLELVPAGFDYFASLRSVFSERLLALYVPDAPRIYLGSDVLGGRREPTLAHEVAHLLQDRSFQLARRLRDPALTHDQRGALQTLIEGAASVLGERLAAGPDESATAEAAPGAELWPDIVARSLDAVYTDGSTLVSALVERGGWESVHRLLAAPPSGTGPLLHPERLGAAAAPPAPVPAAPGSDWALRYTDVLGEQTLRTVLEQGANAQTAAAAASGWRADRVGLFHRQGHAALAWRIELASMADAERWLAASRETWLSALDAPGEDNGWCRAQRDHGVLGAARRGNVALVLSLDAEPSLEEPADAACIELEAWAARIFASPTQNNPG